jgi:hypothetical protein
MNRRSRRSTENRPERPTASAPPVEPVRAEPPSPPSRWRWLLLAVAILAEIAWLVLLTVAKRM